MGTWPLSHLHCQRKSAFVFHWLVSRWTAMMAWVNATQRVAFTAPRAKCNAQSTSVRALHNSCDGNHVIIGAMIFKEEEEKHKEWEMEGFPTTWFRSLSAVAKLLIFERGQGVLNFSAYSPSELPHWIYVTVDCQISYWLKSCWAATLA